MTTTPDVDIDTREDGQQWESPRYAVDDGLFTRGEELVDDETKEKKMDERPYAKRPRGWGEVGFLPGSVDVFGASNRVDV